MIFSLYIFHICEKNDIKLFSLFLKKLEELLMKIFKKASEHRMKSIALPALGTGTLNFPRDKCAESISKAIQLFSSTTPHTSLKVIKVVAFHADQPTIAAFKKVFTRNTVATEIGENFVRGEKIPSGVRRGASKYLSPRASSHNVRPASRFSFASLSCQLVHGDITSEETDAIVVVGDQGLNFGGAVGEAVLKKEGVVFRSKAEKYKPQQLGTTVLLKTSSMKVKYVAHLVASSHRPRYNDLVESVYQMFRDVDKHEIISISIPAIGSGVLGFSPEQSARIIVQAVATASASQDLSYLKKVHIVIYDQNMYETFRKEMISLFSCLDRNEEHQSVGVKSSLKPYTKSAVSVLSNLVTTKSKDVGKAHPKGHDANLAVDSVQEDYVTLVLYSFELRNILNVKRRMEKLVDENITSITTTKQSLTNLPREKKHSLMDYARSLNVSISVEEGGKVTITGCHEDTTKVLEHCHEIATNIVVEASHKEKGYLLAETVQWSKIASDGSRVEYDVSTNLKIEEASSKGENEIRLLLEDDHGIVYNTKFDLKALTVTSLKSGEVSKLERKEKGKGELFQIRLNFVIIIWYLLVSILSRITGLMLFRGKFQANPVSRWNKSTF